MVDDIIIIMIITEKTQNKTNIESLTVIMIIMWDRDFGAKFNAPDFSNERSAIVMWYQYWPFLCMRCYSSIFRGPVCSIDSCECMEVIYMDCNNNYCLFDSMQYIMLTFVQWDQSHQGLRADRVYCPIPELECQPIEVCLIVNVIRFAKLPFCPSQPRRPYNYITFGGKENMLTSNSKFKILSNII